MKKGGVKEITMRKDNGQRRKGRRENRQMMRRKRREKEIDKIAEKSMHWKTKQKQTNKK